MELILVRHAQPDWEPGGRAVDHPALAPLGHAQAQRTADALAREPIDALYVSPLRRARETAEPIAAALGREPEVVSWLRELELPRMEGKTGEEVQRYFRAAHARELENWWDGFPGGESFRHFYERVSAGVEALLVGTHRLRVHLDGGHRVWQVPEPAPRLLLVGHEGTHSVILSYLLGVDPVPWAWLRFSLAWAGLARLRAAPVAGGAVWTLRAFNDTAHLGGLETP